MSELTQSVLQLIDEFAKLPGIGKKSAERLTYHILRIHRNEAMVLADAIQNVKDNVQYCRKCYNLAEGEEWRFAAIRAGEATCSAWWSSPAT